MKAILSSRAFLSAYSGALTTIFALTAILGMAGPSAKSFDQIDVQRINIVEPDGTIKLVLSSKAQFPGLIFKGKEYEHPDRKTAGILFFNDEGTEQGGLTIGGATDEHGTVSAYGHLSFDQYQQDQVVTIDAADNGPYHKAGMSVWDRPNWSIEDLIKVVEQTKTLPEAEQRARIHEFFAGRESAQPRLYLGKSDSGSVSLRLSDANGRERLVVEVAADGTPVLRALDEEGKEIARFPASNP